MKKATNPLEVEVRIVEPSDGYNDISGKLVHVGNIRGLAKHGEKWQSICYPSEEKLRIYSPPSLTELLGGGSGLLQLEVVPIQWHEL